jgi:DNA-directed RNA polymerase subunit N (RpoN/RPB10)
MASGGDAHVGVDCTFHHRHLKSAGACSTLDYVPELRITDSKMAEVQDRLAKRKKRPSKPYTGLVPEAALRECESAHTSGDGTKAKVRGEAFDDFGIASLCCRHDIVIFWANVDTPGEGQKYAVALLDTLFEHLPEHATILGYYDMNCMLALSAELVRPDLCAVDMAL